MGLSAKLFFDQDKDAETLASRITLTDEQLEDAISRKDKLLSYIKPQLSNTLDLNVRHWLQGSYKNFTLIRPVRKGGEFDIDVGVYLLCNAENEGLQANEVKTLLRETLEWFVEREHDPKLEDSKNSCERLSYPESFHIDIPLYYFDDSLKICKLATQKDGWINSDPKALQNWFTDKVSRLDEAQLARLRRIIKYLKAWTALKCKKEERPIPSVALTVLVAILFRYIEFEGVVGRTD